MLSIEIPKYSKNNTLFPLLKWKSVFFKKIRSSDFYRSIYDISKAPASKKEVF